MEILVRLEDSDLEKWYNIQNKMNTIYKMACPSPEYEQACADLKAEKTLFWDFLIKKYPYLRNKQIGLNTSGKFVFSWTTQIEFNTYAR